MHLRLLRQGRYEESTRQRISALVRQLDAEGRGREHLRNPLINGVYNVQYVEDVPGKGKPVGGDFRYSAVGRALFETRDALQIVDGAQGVNLLYFTFLRAFSVPPTPRTNRTRRVPHPVLIGHAASLTFLRAFSVPPQPGRPRKPAAGPVEKHPPSRAGSRA